jgi:hypothetical protein
VCGGCRQACVSAGVCVKCRQAAAGVCAGVGVSGGGGGVVKVLVCVNIQVIK